MWRFLIILFCVSLIPTFLLAQNNVLKPVFQTGHHSKINKIQFCSDNQHLISAADDGKIILWDVQLGLQRESAIAHQGGVLDFDLLNDSVLISIGADKKVCLWTVPDLRLIREVASFKERMNALTVINANLICLVSKHVYFYDLETSQLSRVNYTAKDKFTSVDYSPKLNELAIAGAKENYTATLLINGKLKFSNYLIDNTHKVRFEGDSYLFQANINGTVRYLNTESGKKYTYTLLDDINYVSDMAVYQDKLAFSTAFGYVAILNQKNHSLIQKLRVNGYALTTVDFSENGQWLAAGDINGNIQVYDGQNYTLNQILKSASPGIVDIKVLKDELFIGYNNGLVRRIDLVDNRILSNSIQLDAIEESDGINYAIYKIDSLNNDVLYFRALKTNRHHSKPSKLNTINLLACEWELSANTIIVNKDVTTNSIKKYPKSIFYADKSYQITDFQNNSPVLKLPSKSKIGYRKGEPFFYMIKKNDTVNVETRHEGAISGLKVMPERKIILTYSNDGSVRFWNFEGHYLAALYMSGQYNFVYFDAFNYYYASKEILSKIGFLNFGKLYSYEQYDLFYNRPDKVMEKLPFLEKQDIEILKLAYHKRLEKLGVTINQLNIIDHIPELNIEYLNNYSTKQEQVSFELKASDPHSGIGSITYILNGIEHKEDLKGFPKSINKKISITLSPGINQIEFYCKSKLGVKSLISKEVVTCEKHFDKPNLYFVSIGMSKYDDKSYNLNYASKDAKEIKNIFSKSKGYNSIYQRTYLDEDMTLDKLSEINSFLKQAKISDVVILFYAGHGVLNVDLEYYLATYDMDFEQPELKGLSFDNLEASIENLNCRNKLMIIDACHSGEIDNSAVIIKPSDEEKVDQIKFRDAGVNITDENDFKIGVLELSKLLFIDMRVSQGTNIISSSSGTEYAIEGDEWKNGVFTYALKNAISKKKADLNGDDQIRVMELQMYLRNEVSNLSGGKQNPISRKENFKNNFVVW